MSPVSASDVSNLRARTGVPMLACKEALEEAQGDMDKAIEILRKRGIAQAVKKADRSQHEGALFISQKEGKAALVSLKCETDFVARNDAFTTLGQSLSATLLEQGEDATKKAAEAAMPEAVQKLGENISLGDMQEIAAPTIGSYVHSNRKIAVIIGFCLGLGGALTWNDRRMSSMIQDRVGPNRARFVLPTMVARIMYFTVSR